MQIQTLDIFPLIHGSNGRLPCLNLGGNPARSLRLLLLPATPTPRLLLDVPMSSNEYFLLHKAIRYVVGVAAGSFFTEIRVIGEENVPKDGPIIVLVGHRIFIDIFSDNEQCCDPP